MHIPIIPENCLLLDKLFSKYGGSLSYIHMQNAATRAEQLLEKDAIPEYLKVGVKYTKVHNAYTFTIQRLSNKKWALTQVIS